MGTTSAATRVVPNSQGREQMHSVLDKALETLRMKNYQNFARSLVMFFAIRLVTFNEARLDQILSTVRTQIVSAPQ